jgi:hypothetical protein
MIPERLWTISELAAYLGVPKSWIYDRTGPLAQDPVPHFKLGRYLRFDPECEEFKAWLNRTFRVSSNAN